MVEETPLGRIGLVTTTVAAGGMGEVRIAIAGGTRTYGAFGVDREVAVPTGTRVRVVELFPPRTVVVAPVEPVARGRGSLSGLAELSGPQDTPGWTGG